MKRYLLLLSLCLAGISSFASRLSPETTVSLITCAPGKDFYEVFGHTAIRIHDPERGFDKAYNYGIFDFERPDFYSNFAKGNLIYMLGVWNYRGFARSYAESNRAVTEQVLDLTEAEKQTMYDYLENNALRENREYVYNYFFNNCSTKPRDVVEMALKDKLVYDYSFIKQPMTIRQLIDECSVENSWGDLGIDISLSWVIDRQATPHEFMYLPAELMKAFDKAQIKDGTGTKPLVKQTIQVYVPVPEPPVPADWYSPLNVFWAFFVLVALYTGICFYFKKRGYVFDTLFFGIVGILGIVLFCISFFTNHESAWNMNMLWAFPLHFIAGLLLLFPRLRPRLKYYFMGSGVVLILLLLLWNWLPQDLHYTLIPVILALLLRCANVYYWESKSPVVVASSARVSRTR